MGLWSKLTSATPIPTPATGQQRRAKAVRAADRKGHAAMDAKVHRLTALEADPPRRSWLAPRNGR